VGASLFEESVVEDDGVVLRMRLWGPKPTIRLLALPWVLLWRSRDVDIARWQDDPLLAEGVRRLRELEARDLGSLEWGSVLGTVEEAVDATVNLAALRERYLPAALRDLALFFLLLTVTGRRRHARALLSGMRNQTLELNRALADLAARVRATPALARAFAGASDPGALLRDLREMPEAAPFLEAFEALLARYGHRESVAVLASQPTWRQAPEIPLGAIQALASGRPGSEPSGPPEWEVVRDRLLQHSVLGRRPLRRRFVALLTRARRFMPFREDTHFLFTMGLPVVRRCWLELGRRLMEARVLDAPEDVLHLRGHELAGAGRPWPPPQDAVRALRRKVESRKARRATLGDRLPPLELPPPRAGARRPPDSVPGDGRTLLTGVPASQGMAEGPVRIITGPSAFGRLRDGEVLVAPFTNPAWTPLFQRAAAVVVETGAVMSHAAIVAREYGIPAIMAAAGATRRLTDGERVRVDGTAGTVSATGMRPGPGR
jgi:phosphohistidine swiveling domain-containing protein